MDTNHRTPCGDPVSRRASKGGRLFQLFTLCFTLAVALACTGQPFGSSGGSGGKKKKDRSPPKFVVVVADGDAVPNTLSSSARDGDEERAEDRSPASQLVPK